MQEERPYLSKINLINIDIKDQISPNSHISSIIIVIINLES